MKILLDVKFLIITILLLNQYLYAQMSLNLSGGLSLPIKPSVFHEEWNTGLNFNLGLGYKLSVKSVIELRFSYIKYNYDSKSIPLGYELKGAEIEKLIPSINYKIYPFNSGILKNQFLQLSMGYALVKQNKAEITSNISKFDINGKNNSAGFLNFGMGIDINIFKNVDLLVSVTYDQAYTNLSKFKSIQFISIQSGISIML
jgi:opacity protein-like surface antigen